MDNKQNTSFNSISKTSLIEDSNENSFVIYEDFVDSAQLNSFPERSFTIVLLDHCSGDCHTNVNTYKVESKQVFIHLPNEKVVWNLRRNSFGRRLLINNILMESFTAPIRHTFSSANSYISLNLDTDAYQRLSTEFNAIKKEIESSLVFPELINARARLIALIVHLLISHRYDRKEVNYNSLPHKFHTLVDRYYKEEKSVAFYANELCITPNYLGILCRKQYNISPLAFIHERILLDAKKLLHSTNMPIKEISYSLGYENLAYFSSLFRSHTGKGPKEYRKLMQKIN
ncbi:helix-turn-helix domain-containing protein [Chryseobacterium sp. CKR4-1]|uniref:helix-turn-helix domain-containing protein n=1 Tax=Chryseobacterium sp. CKR4-1 TaxID=3068896 RepID=UPI0027963EFE|nr:helix-turn-helix domain-containing protein [Chryseobacterium sp. CKR4-1]MDQ1805099.1 helix-turn-helix domain-containing protein [Chryseobacterium sp. CKR4-1]